MNSTHDLDRLKEKLRDIHHLTDAAALLSWDQETYMPAGGGQARADQIATLQTLAHDQCVSSDMADLLSPWIDLETGHIREDAQPSLNPSEHALLRETWRDFHRAQKLPSSFVHRLEQECSLAQQVWTEARQRNDFALFLPYLRTVVGLKLEETEYLGYAESPYDALLDTYEPGATAAALQPLFSTLREQLARLLERVRQSPMKPDPSILTQSFSTDRQLAFSRQVLETMGYRFEHGRLDLSAHPFTTSFHPTDVRLTTRVFERDLPSCLFSCIHEGGHGLYDQGLSPDHYGTPLGEPISLGIHESQSRLWENSVGRSLPFWRHFYPLLQQTFPEQLGSVPLEPFYAAINRVEPSLIRVEADELTYNFHIMLRFEIELDLIEGRLTVEELPAIWNQKMKEYLGVVPDRDADGVLQDVHWSFGAFGYFPTYTLGNIYAAMFYEQACHDLPDLEQHIGQGQLLPLKNWLNSKVHRWGRQFTSQELVQRVTGQSPSPDAFLRSLSQKFTNLYQLPAIS